MPFLIRLPPCLTVKKRFGLHSARKFLREVLRDSENDIIWTSIIGLAITQKGRGKKNQIFFLVIHRTFFIPFLFFRVEGKRVLFLFSQNGVLFDGSQKIDLF